jgi:formyltetrahydrofolate deformylase
VSPDASSAIVLAHGPLRERVAATLTDFVYRNGGRIVAHDQYVDHERGRYFTRLEWPLAGFGVPRAAIRDGLAKAVGPFQLRFELHFSDDVPRVAIFVSKLAHCLYDIIGRWRSGEWRIDIPLIVSNHEDLADIAKRFDVEFQWVPIDPQNARTQEARELALLSERGVEVLVLARYMRIVGPELVAAYPNRIINIHHAFLPAVPGARPYDAAHRRGVKIIGATSHYVTDELDGGPIIEQDVIRVSHATSVQDMIRLGRDLEKMVLARAIWAHVQRKVLVDEGRTVIFG